MQIHFIGIGGIGVSALAKYCLAQGYQVSGCDLARSEITDQLKAMGAKIRIGLPRESCVPAGVEKIIYSPAVPITNPEIQSTKLKIQNKSQNPKSKILSYPEALGELTKVYNTIAVSGTHGKSTTTAMIGLLLAKAGLNPTVVVGTKVKEFGNSNFRMGGYPDTKYKIQDTKYLVIEADEHFASFLNYWPKIIVLTTIEADHLDYWKTLKNLLNGFKKYVAHVPKDGYVVANRDDQNIRHLLRSINRTTVPNVLQFSTKQRDAEKLQKILKVPGQYNVSNALAALNVARTLGVKDIVIFKALGEFHGTWRRFEIFNLKTKNYKPYTLVSDYGHHPTEVRVTMQAAREKWPASSAGKPGKKIWLVFQPHQYQRTYYLWKDLVKILSVLPVEKLILTDIYDVAGREEGSIRRKVSSAKLVKAIQGYKPRYEVLHIPTVLEAEEFLKKNIRGQEVVMVMGAGDIYNLTLGLTLHHFSNGEGLTKKHPKRKMKA